MPQAPGRRRGPGRGSSADPGESADALIAAATRAHERPDRGELRVLPSGDTSQHPAALLSGESLGTIFEELGHSEYRYVIVEGPPLLGPIDGQLVARWADAVLVVCRLDRHLARTTRTELGEVLARLRRAGARRPCVIGGCSVCYSLPAWTPVRANRRRSSQAAPGPTHRPRPDQPRHEPQVAPVQRVDERAVGEQAAPGGEQRRRADAVGVAALPPRCATADRRA